MNNEIGYIHHVGHVVRDIELERFGAISIMSLEEEKILFQEKAREPGFSVNFYLY